MIGISREFSSVSEQLIDWLERLVSDMDHYVSTARLNQSLSLTHSWIVVSSFCCAWYITVRQCRLSLSLSLSLYV